MKCKVKAISPVNPTEDLQKVIKAISNVFEYEELEIGEGYVAISGELDCLLPLKEHLEKGQIRDAARRIFIKGENSGEISFKLNKQAALVGKVNLVDGELSPLGEIEVTLTSSNSQELIEWLC
ncbi:MAG TPA: RNA-binding domain-containing protein [Methanobacteriaceae archaeon]|nr:RNA-binding domain-containing protein [Methanobacteriaceae archaeon]